MPGKGQIQCIRIIHLPMACSVNGLSECTNYTADVSEWLGPRMDQLGEPNASTLLLTSRRRAWARKRSGKVLYRRADNQPGAA